ncbi:conserved hypothetical protein [Thermosinus carboxydivorans Nor1]|uniref:DUF2225 domain-containing protein n=1 Tax=Thermosinus carboxydivorans Nor1 TaxID=401526 RepID=A1HT28_9FIRM|nr:DUF2225 domain-containing protein [Thermosinus carboxydivorans]EAX46795.1 conserved hypothetical protein [Thermosinus carboxydivorans Nor1]
MAASLLYDTEKPCPVCEKTFTVTKVRSRLVTLRQDSDFCTYYKDINPYYYDIWVCPHCGYAAPENWFASLPPTGREKVRAFLGGRQVNVNFAGERTREQAIAAFKLAIFYAGLVEADHSRQGGLYLKLAWLYREAGEAASEQAALKKALEHYEQALFRERLPIGNMSEITLMYLVGELARRTGDYDKALSYFGRLVSDPRAKLEKRVLELAREAWHEAREAKKGQAEATSQVEELSREQL